jgi:hypothetical protein
MLVYCTEDRCCPVGLETDAVRLDRRQIMFCLTGDRRCSTGPQIDAALLTEDSCFSVGLETDVVLSDKRQLLLC